jgi:hypothetical protein
VPAQFFSFSRGVAEASAALQIVMLRGSSERSVELADDAVFNAVLGWPQRPLPTGHPALKTSTTARDRLLEAIVHCVRLPGVSLSAHAEAVRRWLVPPKPKPTIASLRALPEARWHRAKELLLAKRLWLLGASDEALRALADERTAPPRAAFSTTFRLALARPTAFRAPPRALWTDGIRKSEQSALATLDLSQTLALMRPDTPMAAWDSALSYFVQCGLRHFGEAYTAEGVRALAAYLARRRAALGVDAPIVEVGTRDLTRLDLTRLDSTRLDSTRLCLLGR